MNQTIEQINHPGRKQTLCLINKQCLAATPPSKGGESAAFTSAQHFIKVATFNRIGLE
jgi:hypothetical protein